MEDVRQYILSIIAAALICSIVNGFFSAKGTHGAIMKLITGLFLTVTIIAPLTNFQLPNIESYFNDLSLDANSIVESGQISAEKERNEIIESKSEMLVLNKAASMNAEITADITLAGDPPIPQSITLTGKVSPYSKRLLTQYIQETLGIAEESQQWM